MNTLLFPVLFLVFAVLVLWILIGCKGWWVGKMWIINITLIMILLLWFSIGSYLGWASDSAMPGRFRLIGFHAQEPDYLFLLIESNENDNAKKSRNILDSFKYRPQDNSVRLHKIPYDQKMHKSLEEAAERILKGGYVIASKEQIFGAEQLDKSGKMGDPSFSFLGDYNFYILPPSLFMKKPVK